MSEPRADVLAEEVAATLKASGKGGGRTNDHEQTMVVAVAENQRGELREADVALSLSTGGGKPGSGYSAVRKGPMIRRLTPTERERLMGAPDGWTNDHGASLADALLSFPAEDRAPVDLTPDGRREAATGDGVAVPVAEWIGHRIRSVGACGEGAVGQRRDERWDHGMNGWRARVVYGRSGASQEGEITGYEHPGMVFLVMDGEEVPIKVNWCDVRPA